jgi:hypothetical protein
MLRPVDIAWSVVTGVVSGLLVLILGLVVRPHDLLATAVIALIVAVAVMVWLQRRRGRRGVPASGRRSVVATGVGSKINMPNLRARGYDEIFDLTDSEGNAPDADVEGPVNPSQEGEE